MGRLVPEKWAFGLFDCHRNVGILCLIADRKQATLFPLIQQYVAPGTIIHSDRAAMYVDNRFNPPTSHITTIVVNPPYRHVSVNHKKEFVDPRTGACTNRVEGFWKHAKDKNRAMSGTNEELLPSYLDEFQWRQMWGKKTTEAFDSILAQIAQFYPVNNWIILNLMNFVVANKNFWRNEWLITSWCFVIRHFVIFTSGEISKCQMFESRSGTRHLQNPSSDS